MVIVVVIVIGLIVGSFLNVVINRLYTKEPIIWSRSHCANCKRELKVLDLIPLVSFFYLQGKCRYCKQKLSWQYPLVELITAITFVLLFISHRSQITDHGFWFQLVTACVLIVIAVYDYKHYLILDKIVFPGIVLALIYQLIFAYNIVWSLLGAVIVAGFFGLQYLISAGRWIGLGDVKLGILLGLIFGKLSLGFLMASYILGAIIGLGLIVFSGKNLKSHLPFGTILSISAIIFMLYGNKLVSWYLGLLGL